MEPSRYGTSDPVLPPQHPSLSLTPSPPSPPTMIASSAPPLSGHATSSPSAQGSLIWTATTPRRTSVAQSATLPVDRGCSQDPTAGRSVWPTPPPSSGSLSAATRTRSSSVAGTAQAHSLPAREQTRLHACGNCTKLVTELNHARGSWVTSSSVEQP